ncbi:MAG: hypothetical protein IPJ38_05830 [Dechloromonas sp.]|uniref:Uncharacterized protein n=1 Tax=Candidatus Dechloromonas phosphorivorans TaxID=2899244 RepID=A0A935JVW0_9RHOO|nr:hypothetical protein [Candidatus Dechloromonas phosphorivorans]
MLLIPLLYVYYSFSAAAKLLIKSKSLFFDFAGLDDSGFSCGLGALSTGLLTGVSLGFVVFPDGLS